MALRKKAGGIVRSGSTRVAAGALQLTAAGASGLKKIAGGISHVAGTASNLATHLSGGRGSKQPQPPPQQQKEALGMTTPEVSVVDAGQDLPSNVDASKTERVDLEGVGAVAEARMSETRGGRADRMSKRAAAPVDTVAEEN